VDVALGKVDYMEIVGFSDHGITARVWYQLLNLDSAYRRRAAPTPWRISLRCAAL